MKRKRERKEIQHTDEEKGHTGRETQTETRDRERSEIESV